MKELFTSFIEKCKKYHKALVALGVVGVTILYIFANFLNGSVSLMLDVFVPIIACIIYIVSFFEHKRIAEKTNIDYLTGVYNREYFYDTIKKEINNKNEFHILIVDLNKFKVINDTYGHHAGDALLVEVTKRLKFSLRKVDIIARLGGDEFGIILHGANTNTSLNILLKRIVASTTQLPFQYNTDYLPVKFSIGAASYPKDSQDVDSLIQKADSTMYYAKKEKLDFFIFDEMQYINPTDERFMIIELEKALNNDQLEVVYQPKVSLKTGKILGCEVLSRWTHPTLGIISPDKFIKLAEREGLINILLKNVLTKVFTDIMQMREDGVNDITIGINVSADNLNNMDIVSDILTEAKNFNIDLSKIILEVTETAIMKDPNESIKYLVMLNSIGMKLGIDDFGTGNSSFIYLKYLPIHEIKIDRTFIADMMHVNTDLIIVNTTINLAKSCNITTVAEGVESKDQLDKLKDLDCDVVQGYFISKPLKIDKFIKFVKEYENDKI